MKIQEFFDENGYELKEVLKECVTEYYDINKSNVSNTCINISVTGNSI